MKPISLTRVLYHVAALCQIESEKPHVLKATQWPIMQQGEEGKRMAGSKGEKDGLTGAIRNRAAMPASVSRGPRKKGPVPKAKADTPVTPIAPKPARAAKAKAAAPAPPPKTPTPPAPKPAAVPDTSPPASLQTVAQSLSTDQLDVLSRNLAQAMTKANDVFSTAFQDQSRGGNEPWAADPFAVQDATNAVWSKLAAQPETLRDAQGNLWQRYADIWERHALKMMMGEALTNSAPVRDKRFRDPEWTTNPAFSLMRETYLATAAFITDMVEKAEGVDEEAKRKASFFIKQAVDAASPSNFLMSNPAALRALIETRGQSLLQGLDNLAGDLKRGGGKLSITQTDMNAFTVGENIATTPGKVVFRNGLIEILQYLPTTATTFDAPLLIFPPWINKFYIMDLQAKNSMIKWLVAQGHTVFLASWINPDTSMAEKTFEDYMRDGVFAAVQAVQDACGASQINTVGYCIGGTLLAATLAYMATVGDKRIQSATFFASQQDFTNAGDLMVFSDDAGLRYLEARIDSKGGLLDAQAMADTFNSLRANDLIWNYVVDNYYMGRSPPPFDLLYWNADQTRMPRALHLFYLRAFYHDNLMAQGKLELLGEKIDLSRVTIPIFMQSSKEDHIAPYQSIYRGAKLFGGPVNFMMAGSGHIAGVINHPDANKYQHWTNAALPDTVEEWMEGAVEHPGSWWPKWHDWLSKISGKQVKARTPGAGKLKVLCDAPGEYVRIRSST
ncbi:MAG: class I poly(R)-hydroxyalkanoic acid synthase [Caulobacterales bacterium]